MIPRGVTCSMVFYITLTIIEINLNALLFKKNSEMKNLLQNLVVYYNKFYVFERNSELKRFF